MSIWKNTHRSTSAAAGDLLKLLLPALLVLALLLTVSCKGPGKAKAEAADAAGKDGAAEAAAEVTVFAVSATEAVRGQIKDYIEVNGDVVSKTTVETFPDTAGKLSRISVNLGEKVRKNQIIAEVDPSKPGMKFEASPVRAAIGGTVTNLPAQEGSTVSPQMSVAQISKMDEMRIHTDVAERFISKMKPGLKVIINSDAYPDRVYRGRVSELSPVVDPQTRMMEVKIDFTEGSEGLKSGMFVKAKIITDEKEDIVKVPVDCVVERFAVDYVFIVRDHDEGTEDRVVERREVKTGIEVDRKVEILEGLDGGEDVVYRGQTLLEDGSRVRVVSYVKALTPEDEIE
jgi:membrane fusion protein, multidrug efflux system